jgi:DegT/DnrJ/EryC1/StrS aminotransferase family
VLDLVNDLLGERVEPVFTPSRPRSFCNMTTGLPSNDRPAAEPGSVASATAEVLANGVLTNGSYVCRLEETAAAHAVAWNGLRSVFTDIRPDTLLHDPPAAARAVGMRPSAILATHTYGTPCDVALSKAPGATASGCSSTPPTPGWPPGRRGGEGHRCASAKPESPARG